MTSELAIALSSGGFALLGVGMANWLAGRRESRTFRRQVAIDLAEVERLVWGDDLLALHVELQRLNARLTIAGVPSDVVETLNTVSLACFQSIQDDLEQSGGKHRGINPELSDARRALQEVAGSYC